MNFLRHEYQVLLFLVRKDSQETTRNKWLCSKHIPNSEMGVNVRENEEWHSWSHPLSLLSYGENMHTYYHLGIKRVYLVKKWADHHAAKSFSHLYYC